MLHLFLPISYQTIGLFNYNKGYGVEFLDDHGFIFFSDYSSSAHMTYIKKTDSYRSSVSVPGSFITPIYYFDECTGSFTISTSMDFLFLAGYLNKQFDKVYFDNTGNSVTFNMNDFNQSNWYNLVFLFPNDKDVKISAPTGFGDFSYEYGSIKNRNKINASKDLQNDLTEINFIYFTISPPILPPSQESVFTISISDSNNVQSVSAKHPISGWFTEKELNKISGKMKNKVLSIVFGIFGGILLIILIIVIIILIVFCGGCKCFHKENDYAKVLNQDLNMKECNDEDSNDIPPINGSLSNL